MSCVLSWNVISSGWRNAQREDVNSPEIWDVIVEELELEGLMKFSSVRIPLFTDATSGFA